jgi:hypothetical protein
MKAPYKKITKYLKNKMIEFEWWLFVLRKAQCKECGDGEFYPIYGVSPHEHIIIKGSWMTIFLPKEEWPKNFVEDFEGAECGVYYCPNENCTYSYEGYLKLQDKENK